MTLSVEAYPRTRTPLTARLPSLKVIGLGGGGSNAVNRMIELGISGVDFITANTDLQALKSSLAPVKVQLGPRLTRGLGSGGNSDIGEAAAEESYKDICAALNGADMVFLTAGMGGGSGTGAIPVAARAAQAIGAVCVAIVTLPFSFEVGKRQTNARIGLEKLRQHTDTLITVPNDRLLAVAPHDLPIEAAFQLADDVLRQGIQGISEIINQSGMINVDFAHIRNLMLNGGGSIMSIGQGQGYNKASKALQNALHHPLLESIPLDDTTGIIASFTGCADLTFHEVAEALEQLQNLTGGKADIIPGITINNQMEDRVQVILVITGLGATSVDTHKKLNLKDADRGIKPVINDQPYPLDPQSAQDLEMATTAADLDLPAFLRRRNR
jgi:cell division protein FtsZ